MSTRPKRISCQDKIRIHNHPRLREFLAEALGTFILMVFGLGSNAQFVLSNGRSGSMLSVNWSWAIGVVLGVYVAGGVSGGHINPAVTVAQAFLGRIDYVKTSIYICAQYFGSFLASLCIYLVYIDALNAFDGGERRVVGGTATAGIWGTYPRPEVSTWNGFGDQILSTALLLICILAITDKKNMAPTSSLSPFPIGLIVFGIGMAFGHNCGYAVNPARDLSPRIFTLMAGWGYEVISYRNFNWFWVPVLGPHIGAILGAFIYRFCIELHWPDKQDEKLEEKNVMLGDNDEHETKEI